MISGLVHTGERAWSATSDIWACSSRKHFGLFTSDWRRRVSKHLGIDWHFVRTPREHTIESSFRVPIVRSTLATGYGLFTRTLASYGGAFETAARKVAVFLAEDYSSNSLEFQACPAKHLVQADKAWVLIYCLLLDISGPAEFFEDWWVPGSMAGEGISTWDALIQAITSWSSGIRSP